MSSLPIPTPTTSATSSALTIDTHACGSEGTKEGLRKIESVFTPYRGHCIPSNKYKDFGSSLHVFVMGIDQARVHAQLYFPEAHICIHEQLGEESVSEDLLKAMGAPIVVLLGPPAISVLSLLLHKRGDWAFAQCIASVRVLPPSKPKHQKIIIYSSTHPDTWWRSKFQFQFDQTHNPLYKCDCQSHSYLGQADWSREESDRVKFEHLHLIPTFTKDTPPPDRRSYGSDVEETTLRVVMQRKCRWFILNYVRDLVLPVAPPSDISMTDGTEKKKEMEGTV